MRVYFISGLAADERVFRNIRLPAGFEIVHLHWISPAKEESLEHYALRLAAGIDQSEPFALLGLSMGGMIAAIIARHYTAAATILISSVPAAGFLPPWFRWGGKLGLHKMVPMRLLTSISLLKRLFSAETPQDKKVLRQVIRDSNPNFVRWAIEAILTWKEEELPRAYKHIHGSRDEVLPIRYLRPTHLIKGGGHIMIMNRAAEINQLLKDILNNIRT